VIFERSAAGGHTRPGIRGSSRCARQGSDRDEALYYSIEKDHVTWSTILDPLCCMRERTFAHLRGVYCGVVCDCFPAAHLTRTWASMRCHVRARCCCGRQKRCEAHHQQVWDFDPAKRIRYRHGCGITKSTSAAFFCAAVQRRLVRPGRCLPISAADGSSSIVCMADLVIARGQANARASTRSPGTTIPTKLG